MKFTIRFADKIVGVFIILALGILVFVVFMLGSSQRWFSRDYFYKTYFNSATGLARNMPVTYKGFTIGHVKTILLSDDDRVEVRFTIFDTYNDRVREGSLVEILVSPIGMGNQFLFYPGKGEAQIPEGETIYTVTSPEGKQMIASGIAIRPERDDSINNLMNQAGTILASINTTLTSINEAIEGNDASELGRIVKNIGQTMQGLPPLVEMLPGEIEGTIESLMAEIKPVLANINTLSAQIASPDGTVMAALDSNGKVYTELTASLHSVSGILRNLEKTTDFVPSQLPQIAALLSDLHTALKTAEDVMIALTNNPLLKGGIPQHKETRAGGSRPRDMEF